MLQKLIYTLFILIVTTFLFTNSDVQTILSGIAIFLIGMIFMEDGFKSFTGGILENILQKSTSSLFKSITTGFVATAFVQSSSLVSIVIISLLSAELISLSGAIGVVFGSNIGTTVTAWIVSVYGVNIKISHFAMPMLVLGVILKFSHQRSLEGVGNILIGVGFVFLGISYMKDGFETLKEGIHLVEYAVQGYMGVLVYVLLGIFVTAIIQSSSATMAIVIVALSTHQILYINALELAIGANIGTTITAILGSIASNENGKRLAVAHAIFNLVTGFIAIIFLYQLSSLVDYLSLHLGIASNDYTMKLALFHTIFNVLGLIVVAPFTSKLVKFLNRLFIVKEEDISRARYLDSTVAEVPDVALLALQKEVEHLYDNTSEALSHALSLHRHTYIGKGDELENIVNASVKVIDLNIDEFYEKKIKMLYGDIIKYATIAQEPMSVEDKQRVYDLKVACRDIVETLKDVTILRKNMNRYIRSQNIKIKKEYNHLREEIARTLDGIHTIREHKDEEDYDVLTKMNMLKDRLDKLDTIKNGRIDTLLKNDEIDTKMVTSLINDSTFAYHISEKLIEISMILWVEQK